ncbi:sperm acrosome-associated protein 7 isoform X3 [Neofelis nebulosa]|uniref:sperm acrosome-associated protein 7 isoform X3 n=1 Tax=Neofelis nebulosa TaxID=61452 RepID=UPI00272BF12C|nr:sperm acrosome-associated protein 7 isoform X3 [Neofelis nebulosa]
MALPARGCRTPLTSCCEVTGRWTLPSPEHRVGPCSLPAVMSQDPGHSRVSWRPRSSGHGLPPSAGGNMAGDRGVTLFVLLLSCWCHTEPQPINTISGTVTGPTTEMPPNSKDQEDIPGIFDDSMNENFEVGGTQNYHGLSDNSQFSIGSEDKIFNNEPSTDQSYRLSNPEGYSESQFSSGGKNLKNDQYKKTSVLDKILQNIGKSSGSSSQ